MTSDTTALHIPAQIIAPPKSISPEGQAFLAAAAQRLAGVSPYEHASVSTLREMGVAALQPLRPLADQFDGHFEIIELDAGAALYRATPAKREGKLAEVALLEIHGGGWVAGGGEMCQMMAKVFARDYGAEVFSIDYRPPPEHPFPASLDDCVAAYREVLKHYRPSAVIVVGASAGGNLAAALMLRLKKEGLPLPLALILQTPALDLSQRGDSHQTNRYLDVNLYGVTGVVELYTAGQDPTNPYLSPLFGDLGGGWPPTMLTSGTRDLLLSDTVRMHRALRRAGVRAELHVWEASPHGGFFGAPTPEGVEFKAEVRRFMYAAWGIDGAR